MLVNSKVAASYFDSTLLRSLPMACINEGPVEASERRLGTKRHVEKGESRNEEKGINGAKRKVGREMRDRRKCSNQNALGLSGKREKNNTRFRVRVQKV